MTVRLEGIRKSFGGLPVLQGVDLAVGAGSILGLVGENGAGKSTLMNILGGAIRPDSGALWIDEERYVPGSAADARRAGIAFVHQELTLFPNLSIAENLQLLDLPRRGRLPWIIDRRASAARARLSLARVGLTLPPDTLVEQLSAGERQLVEIARALAADARVLILDEPTSSLGASERARLLGLMREMARGGMAQIFVSHDLDEVLRSCSDVTVLRDGRVVGGGPVADWTIERLVSLMVGRARGMAGVGGGGAGPGPDSPSAARTADIRLEVRRLSEPGMLREVSLTVARGEIVGIFGLMGAGRSELARRVFGLEAHASGEVLVDGEVVRGGPHARIRHGLALVTEDRRADGLCLSASIADNLTLASLPAFGRGPIGRLDTVAMTTAVRRVRADVGVTPTASEHDPARTLSGGNQQKVVLGKWLMTAPRVLILDEPTRGIDVGARADLWQRLRELAAGGAGLLVLSSDLEELLATADRVLVMRQGAISAVFGRAAFDREAIMRAALPDVVAR